MKNSYVYPLAWAALSTGARGERKGDCEEEATEVEKEQEKKQGLRRFSRPHAGMRQALPGKASGVSNQFVGFY